MSRTPKPPAPQSRPSEPTPGPHPTLEALLRQLAETPEEFLREPRIGSKGEILVSAVVGDLIWDLHGTPPHAADVSRFSHTCGIDQRNSLRLVLISCWLLGADYFRTNPPPADRILAFLGDGVTSLAEFVQAERCVTDPDRREELARTVLDYLNLRPAGESPAQAADRLTTMSSAARQRAIEASRAAEARAKAIRDALAKRAAAESADKWTRE